MRAVNVDAHWKIAEEGRGETRKTVFANALIKGRPQSRLELFLNCSDLYALSTVDLNQTLGLVLRIKNSNLSLRLITCKQKAHFLERGEVLFYLRQCPELWELGIFAATVVQTDLTKKWRSALEDAWCHRDAPPPTLSSPVLDASTPIEVTRGPLIWRRSPMSIKSTRSQNSKCQ